MSDFMPAYVYGDNPDTKVQGPKPQPADREHECDGCNGSGIFYGAGAVVNGHFVGFKGVCFRCGGHGWQNEADRKRNRYYDEHRQYTF